MKKILLTCFLGSILLTLCACGIKQNDSSNNIKKEENKQETNKKFEDLTITKMIGSFDDVWIDLPDWRENGSETCTVIENMNYYIIAVISNEDYSFDELFNNVAKSDLKHFVDRGNYEDFIPDIKEEVTLTNGIEAIKFEGILSMDSYNTLYEYQTYGYYFKFNNYPIMIMSIETAKAGVDKNSEEQRVTTNKYVDEIVQTIKNHN